ncbi:MAG: threonine/serine dehydratase [Deltaproteobacteria bacterium]|nr:threonine/serine dehydratase [Deltaproteobacteria bacterium]MBW2414002.1 threonine/serine dehydratase [Deltaproteobacteria bacterium]
MLGALLTLESIRQAAKRIEGHVLRTPVLYRKPRGDCELWLKAESLQVTGAFKLRGAFNRMAVLPADTRGVVAHSSGNHAQAVAHAAAALGLRAVIVMPNDAPALKRARTEASGAEVVEVGPDSDERARRADELAAEQGLVLVPPFDDPLVAAGQGTAALELIEDSGPLDRFYAPISGGGLMAGCAVAVHGLSPGTEVVGVEPEDADSVRRGLAEGRRVSVPPPRTLADGLRVRTPGEVTWPVIREHVARVALVSDKELLDAMAWALGELRLVLEPSGAAALAAALREGRGRCGVILSGGNVDPALLARVAARIYCTA